MTFKLSFASINERENWVCKFYSLIISHKKLEVDTRFSEKIFVPVFQAVPPQVDRFDIDPHVLSEMFALLTHCRGQYNSAALIKLLWGTVGFHPALHLLTIRFIIFIGIWGRDMKTYYPNPQNKSRIENRKKFSKSNGSAI